MIDNLPAIYQKFSPNGQEIETEVGFPLGWDFKDPTNVKFHKASYKLSSHIYHAIHVAYNLIKQNMIITNQGNKYFKIFTVNILLFRLLLFLGPWELITDN